MRRLGNFSGGADDSSPMGSADLELLARRAAAGDGEAFESLCRALSDDVWRYCSALTGDRDLAMEAGQETFVRAVKAIRRFRGDAPVRVYFLVLARRSVADLLRREFRHRNQRPLDNAPEPARADITGSVDVAMLVAALPDDLRQAFTLTQVLGLPYDAAAEVAGCPVGTVRSRVFRARERLVEMLDVGKDRDVR